MPLISNVSEKKKFLFWNVIGWLWIGTTATVDSRFPGNGAFGATYWQFLAFSVHFLWNTLFLHIYFFAIFFMHKKPMESIIFANGIHFSWKAGTLLQIGSHKIENILHEKTKHQLLFLSNLLQQQWNLITFCVQWWVD